MKRTITALFLLTAAISCAQKPTTLEGSWYGLYTGSPASVTFNPDGTYQMWSEAFSQMNMAGTYTQEGNTLSLGGIPGMDGKGLFAIDGQEMDLLMIFGAPGMVEAPKSFDDGAGNPAATRLHLSKDRRVMDRAAAKVDAPAAARLAFERNKRLGKGLNLNAVLDGETDNPPLKAGAIADIAKQGFQSVRIPIRWGVHTQPAAPYTIDPGFFKKVDAVVDECLANGLAVILDNHYYPTISFSFGPQDLSFEENIDRLYSIWEQLSDHYQGYDDETLYFGILNEPSLQLEPTRWNEIVAKCIRIIRKDNPGKTITVATPSLGQHWTIGLLEFPADEWNLIVDAHYYLPQTFTHQGIAFAMADGVADMPWTGSEMEKAPIALDMNFLAAWSERNGRPVNIGEFGVCDNADDKSRCAWLNFVGSEIISRGMSFCLWAYFRDGFSIYDESSGRWNEGMLKALDLKAGSFQNPDLSYAPMVRWWWPGNDVETAELQREMQLFADHHIGGVEIQSFALVVPMPMDRAAQIMSFDTDSYYAHLKTVMEAATRLGMTVDLTNGSGWPASGSHISEAEENRSLQYGMVEIPLAGGTVEIPRSERQDSEFATMVGLLEAQVSEPAENGSRQIKDVKKVQDATFGPGKADDGFKRVLIALWNVPCQEINMLVAKPDAGRVLDHFSTEVLRKNYDHYFGPETGLDAYYGQPFRAFFNDSYEFKVDRHISDDFVSLFRERRGYDPLPWMPANIWYGYNNMYDNSHPAPEFSFGDEDWRLRYDYDLTVSDLIRKRLLGDSAEWAHEHGLLHRTQAYGLPMDYMGATGDADIPEMETMLFGPGSEGGLKIVSSGAMLYNKTLVTAESGVHINRGLMVTPQKLHSIADKLLSSGVNQMIWHGTPYKYEVNSQSWQPFYNPMLGINFSSDLYEANVFWDEFAEVNQYIQRAQYLMRQGHAEADVLVYYPFLEYSSAVQNPEEILCNGIMPGSDPDQPSAVVPQDENGQWLAAIWPILNELERRGLTWAWVNDESLQEMKAGADGRLHIRGNSYAGLVLYDLPWIQLETARNLARQKNANLLILGDLPGKQPSFEDYAVNDRKTARLMKKAAAGKRICTDASAWKVTIPAALVSGGERVRMARRRTDSGFVQLFWNVDDAWKPVRLQVDAPYVYWLDAEDGSIAEVVRNDAGEMEGLLPPLSTRFLYASDEPLANAIPAREEHASEVVATPVFQGLQPGDWRDVPALQDSAAPAVYKASFTLEKVYGNCILDLGDVYYTAEVFVNGLSAGKRCWKPFCFDITDFVKAGSNTLEIHVKPTDFNARTDAPRMANGLVGPVVCYKSLTTIGSN